MFNRHGLHAWMLGYYETDSRSKRKTYLSLCSQGATPALPQDNGLSSPTDLRRHSKLERRSRADSTAPIHSDWDAREHGAGTADAQRFRGRASDYQSVVT